jgi:hypothetical protein
MWGNSGRIGTFPGKLPSSSPPLPLGDDFVSNIFEWFGLRKVCNKKVKHNVMNTKILELY